MPSFIYRSIQVTPKQINQVQEILIKNLLNFCENDYAFGMIDLDLKDIFENAIEKVTVDNRVSLERIYNFRNIQ
jgi:hypothetical protein